MIYMKKVQTILDPALKRTLIATIKGQLLQGETEKLPQPWVGVSVNS